MIRENLKNITLSLLIAAYPVASYAEKVEQAQIQIPVDDIQRYSTVLEHVKNYCKQIEHKLPYALDDKRLAIGHIHLGKLTHEPDLEQIGQNKYVHSVVSR